VPGSVVDWSKQPSSVADWSKQPSSAADWSKQPRSDQSKTGRGSNYRGKTIFVKRTELHK